jgi:Lon-like protease
MSRRVATIALSAVLLVALIAVAFLIPVPFVTMSPGPTEDTLGKVKSKEIVQITGAETYPTNGELSLTTVAVTSPDQKLDLPGALAAWLDPKVAVMPRSYIYSDNDTPQEVEQRNAAAMETSQLDAIAAALAEVQGKPIPKDVVVVLAIAEGAPALGKLEAGDIIRTVDGQPIRTADDVVKAVRKHKVGDEVDFQVTRDRKQVNVTVPTVKSPDDPNRPMVGITPDMGYDFPYDVKVNLGQDIGGPSAGTMFALAIVDKLTPESLTDGKHIAGTGTIDAAGKVGPIGGIQQKIAGAERDGASVFLVPNDNCDEAAAAKIDGIRLVRVKTLADAVDSLEALADGNGKIPSCSG